MDYKKLEEKTKKIIGNLHKLNININLYQN